MDPESSKARQKVLSALRGRGSGRVRLGSGGTLSLEQRESHVEMAVSELTLE